MCGIILIGSIDWYSKQKEGEPIFAWTDSWKTVYLSVCRHTQLIKAGAMGSPRGPISLFLVLGYGFLRSGKTGYKRANYLIDRGLYLRGCSKRHSQVDQVMWFPYFLKGGSHPCHPQPSLQALEEIDPLQHPRTFTARRRWSTNTLVGFKSPWAMEGRSPWR